VHNKSQILLVQFSLFYIVPQNVISGGTYQKFSCLFRSQHCFVPQNKCPQTPGWWGGAATPRTPPPLSAFGLDFRPFGLAPNEKSWARPWRSHAVSTTLTTSRTLAGRQHDPVETLSGGAENDGHEIAGQEIAGHENAGHETARHLGLCT